MAHLLLHSLREFQDILLGLMDAVEARSVVEVGVEDGGFSAALSAWAAVDGRRHVGIDPAPSQAARDIFETSDSQLYLSTSLHMLARLPGADAYVLDGDHNYFTVLGELSAIAAMRPLDRPFPLVILHDVGWPCGRRDFYYDPQQLPAEAVHPYSYDLGVKLDRPSAQPGGFRGEGNFAVALQEGGPRNGVLTAIEDFRRDQPGLFYTEIPCIFGIGILADARLEAKLMPVLSAFANNPLLAKMERNRLELYLQVLLLQDQLNQSRGLAKAG